MSNCTIGTLSKDVFERRTSTGSEALSLFICLDANKLVLLSFFSLLKTIYPRVSTKPLPNDAKSPLPVDVRPSKTLLLKLPNRTLLGTLSLLLLVITKLQGKLGESSSLKTLPQCTSPQHGPRLRAALKWPISRLNTVHLYRRLVVEVCSSLSRAYCSYKLPRACCNIPLLQERSSLYFLLVLVFYECFKL